MIPPMSFSASTRWTRRRPRLPSTIAHSIPAGPAPTTRTSRSRFSAGSNRSGCQPRGTPRRRSRSACSRRSRRDPTSGCRCCSRCTRGSRPAGLPRSCAEGTGRRSTAAQRRSRPRRRSSHLGHLIRVGEPRDADDRLRRRLADVLRPFELPALLEEAGRPSPSTTPSPSRSPRPRGRPGGRPGGRTRALRPDRRRRG